MRLSPVAARMRPPAARTHATHADSSPTLTATPTTAAAAAAAATAAGATAAFPNIVPVYVRTYVHVWTRNLVPFIQSRTNTRAPRITRVVASARSRVSFSLSLFLSPFPSLFVFLRIFLRVRKKYGRHKRERMRGAREGGQYERPSDRTSEGEEKEEEDHTPFVGAVLLFHAIPRCIETRAFSRHYSLFRDYKQKSEILYYYPSNYPIIYSIIFNSIIFDNNWPK